MKSTVLVQLIGALSMLGFSLVDAIIAWLTELNFEYSIVNKPTLGY